MKRFLKTVLVSVLCLSSRLECGPNQTDTLSPIYTEDLLPFTIRIDVADFALPSGIQSYASAIRNGKWLLLAGRSNGVHGFSNVGNNFPPLAQNTNVYVVEPSTGTTWMRSLTEGGLSQGEIDSLSVTASGVLSKGEHTLFHRGIRYQYRHRPDGRRRIPLQRSILIV